LNPHGLATCGFSYRFGFYRLRHKAHSEQPPAAARARGFAAKNAPAGQRQIRTNIRSDELGIELPAPASATAPAKDGFGRVLPEKYLVYLYLFTLYLPS